MSGGSAQPASGGSKSPGIAWEGLVGFFLLALALYVADFCPAGFDANNQPAPAALHRDAAWLACVAGWLVIGLLSHRLFPSGIVGRARYFTGAVVLGLFAAMAMAAAGGLDTPGSTDFRFPMLAGLVALPFLAVGVAVYKFLADPPFMQELDRQGWFGTGAYKPQQGHRMRRATLAGLWLFIGSGVYTAWQAGVLAPANLTMPFTGYYAVSDPHDAEFITVESAGIAPMTKGDHVSRLEYSRIVGLMSSGSSGQLVKIRGDRQEIPVDGKPMVFEPGRLASHETVRKINRLISNPDEKAYFGIYREIQFKDAVPPAVRPDGRGQVMLLPSRGTQALVFTALLVWLAVRLVQVPAFADFLISTDAEMNKVSWASRTKLWQDTVVVIVGMLLMAALMMGLDQMWRGVLTATSVLQFNSGGDERNRSVEQRTW